MVFYQIYFSLRPARILQDIVFCLVFGVYITLHSVGAPIRWKQGKKLKNDVCERIFPTWEHMGAMPAVFSFTYWCKFRVSGNTLQSLGSPVAVHPDLGPYFCWFMSHLHHLYHLCQIQMWVNLMSQPIVTIVNPIHLGPDFHAASYPHQSCFISFVLLLRIIFENGQFRSI